MYFSLMDDIDGTYSEKFEIFAQRSDRVLFFEWKDQAGALCRVLTFFDVVSPMYQRRLLKIVISLKMRSPIVYVTA